MASTTQPEQPWFLKSSCPVLFPFNDALRKPQAEFGSFLRDELSRRHDEAATVEAGTGQDQAMTDAGESETFTLVSNTTSGAIRKGLGAMEVADSESQETKPQDTKAAESNPFMEGLVTYEKEEEKPPRDLKNMMQTENADLAYRSTNDSLVDLFQELEDVLSGPRLVELLSAAWKADPLDTLKIIFNARSIHLGKSSRNTFYRCAGWLAQNHPLTLVANLQWLSRPVIEKKAKKEGDDDIVIVDEKAEDDPTKYDVKHGVAHGYWKDLLNMLALAANNKFDALSDPRDVLNSENPGIIRGKSIKKLGGRGGRRARGTARAIRAGRGRGRKQRRRRNPAKNEEPVKKTRLNPQERRRETRAERHKAAVDAFNTNPVYRALHLAIARQFSEQLDKDLRTLRGSDEKAKRSISLCGKWAPSHDHFHDRHTFIVSTIAEVLYPRDSIDNERLSPTDDRETYLRFAREQYRKDTSALRKHLEIVERDITANKFENIKYDRVPSLAMNNYSKLFIEKDFDRFEKYIDKVAEGKANISGATLLPSTLIQKVRSINSNVAGLQSAHQLVEQKMLQIESKVFDGQWNTLVQRIKDSGALESSIAICDVSGSMLSPQFPDKTTPMDSAIGLSLLIAEAAKPPFAGAFITFSAKPVVERVDLTKSLKEKYDTLSDSDWGMNTNFVAVFEDLILPMAIKNNLKQEDMVKRVFVFSDMQFDAAQETYSWGTDTDESIPGWSTSFERIRDKYQKAGYEMPELVFWNLAGGRAGYTGEDGDPTAPKPVKSDEDGTCLVSGYSQGMLKVFLEGGSFEDLEEENEEEEEVVVVKDEDGNVSEQPKKKKAKMDPIRIVKKAISHKAYDMLKVVD
ncbi:hypothetical protein NM208_g7933 [Fusarium decemcellulare]|uniref:Uncharacterized protein n=1 Tax=Fusarium decemcellulare TaxID=57161 RepID=A0ACC1S7D1_9HYPO|nr:hypothetical protein NM208_g7933 [Fusarium decemcellulare]